jgi:membrane protein implicated in regulation of membrane protease activity
MIAYIFVAVGGLIGGWCVVMFLSPWQQMVAVAVMTAIAVMPKPKWYEALEAKELEWRNRKAAKESPAT